MTCLVSGARRSCSLPPHATPGPETRQAKGRFFRNRGAQGQGASDGIARNPARWCPRSWDQDVVASEGVHQFGNIHLFTGAVPEPASLALLAVGIALAVAYTHHSRVALSRRKRVGEVWRP